MMSVPYLVSMITCIVVVFDLVAGLTAELPLFLPIAHVWLILDQLVTLPVTVILKPALVVSVNIGFCERKCQGIDQSVK